MPPDHDPRTSPLRHARLTRGWCCLDVVENVHAICAQATGEPCRLNVHKLRHYEDGSRHPGPAHVTALSRVFEQSPQDLGLTV